MSALLNEEILFFATDPVTLIALIGMLLFLKGYGCDLISFVTVTGCCCFVLLTI